MSLWRFKDHLPTTKPVSLEEGDTPLIKLEAISKELGAEVYGKYEGLNPTGSFKDRGMTVAVSVAKETGAKISVCASTGNTAASAAAYSARAGIKSVVLLPEGKVALGKLAQAFAYGAQVVTIRGNFDRALELARELVDKRSLVLLNSLNPYRLEGQKTGAFEVLEALKAIDNLSIPVGNGGNITAWGMGFKELGANPRLLGFQAEGSAPLVRGEIVKNPETVASAIRIGNPVRGAEALEVVKASQGEIRAVSDKEILEAQKLIAEEGVFVEPASAASVAGILKYGVKGITVCVLTGNGLKDSQLFIPKDPLISIEPTLEALEEIL